MYDRQIGISVLTNGQRLSALQSCLGSLLAFSYYRPVVFGIFNNGSTDGTRKWLDDWVASKDNPWKYGVTFRVQHSDSDLGCAAGTNGSIKLVGDTEYHIHLESDFSHISPEESGISRLWVRDAINLLESGDADYIYLRKLRSDAEMAMHWFHQWKEKIVEERPPFKRVDGFWWSNNPSIFRMSAMLKSGTLPLDEKKDGAKGTPNWSAPELLAPRPTKTWMWGYGNGMFVHEG